MLDLPETDRVRRGLHRRNFPALQQAPGRLETGLVQVLRRREAGEAFQLPEKRRSAHRQRIREHFGGQVEIAEAFFYQFFKILQPCLFLRSDRWTVDGGRQEEGHPPLTAHRPPSTVDRLP